MRKLKKDYVTGTVLLTISGNNGKIWQSFRSIVPNKCCDSTIQSVTVNNQDINDPHALTKSFNEYFTGIVKEIKKAHTFKGNFKKFIKKQTKSVFKFSQVTEQECLILPIHC